MKKVFVQMGGGLGCVSRTLPVLKELQKRGYEIRYSGFKSADSYMEKLGIKKLSEDFDFTDREHVAPVSDWSCPEQFWEIMGYSNRGWIEKKLNQLIPLLNEYKPDLIISDLGLLAWLVAKILRIKLVTLTQSCYHPEREFKKFRWWEDKDECKLNFTLKNLLNEFLEKYSVSTIQSFDEVFTGNITFIASYEEIDKTIRDTPDKYNTVYIGPMLYDEDGDVEQYKEFFASDSDKNSKVFCYTGRFYDHVGKSGEIVFRNIVDAFYNKSEKVIIAVGGKDDERIGKQIIESEYPNCKNILVTDFVPMNFGYKYADIVIHHGGHGSSLAQTKYCIPGLIIPSHSEREYNAWLFKKLGFSEVISLDKLSGNNIYKTVKILLTDTIYKHNLIDFKKSIEAKKCNGVDKAADLIEDLLK